MSPLQKVVLVIAITLSALAAVLVTARLGNDSAAILQVVMWIGVWFALTSWLAVLFLSSHDQLLSLNRHNGQQLAALVRTVDMLLSLNRHNAEHVISVLKAVDDLRATMVEYGDTRAMDGQLAAMRALTPNDGRPNLSSVD